MAAITFTDVSIDIPVFNAGNRSLKNRVISVATGGQIRQRDGGRLVVRALDQVSFEIAHGARVGLIGHNGSGKSTMLRVMAGIYEPSTGEVRVEGEIAPVFDIGFGMDPDATGWENMILRGILIGLTQEEIRDRMPDIAEVAGLGEFLDMPIRAYSSGMLARLAFAISTSVKADVVLLDEGIGTGDNNFLERARKRVETFVGEAGLLVVASHSEELLRQWCTTAIWLHHGRVRLHGPLEEVIAAYHAGAEA